MIYVNWESWKIFYWVRRCKNRMMLLELVHSDLNLSDNFPCYTTNLTPHPPLTYGHYHPDQYKSHIQIKSFNLFTELLWKQHCLHCRISSPFPFDIVTIHFPLQFIFHFLLWEASKLFYSSFESFEYVAKESRGQWRRNLKFYSANIQNILWTLYA
jgi:hypothetical protein